MDSDESAVCQIADKVPGVEWPSYLKYRDQRKMLDVTVVPRTNAGRRS